MNMNEVGPSVHGSNPVISTVPQANLNETYYSNMNSRVSATQPTNNSTGSSGSRRLNPTAQVFVPRGLVPTPGPSFNGPQANVGVPTNNHSMPNGNVNNIQSSSLLEGENDIEDYIALSYLKEFISSISNKPSIYDLGINEITAIVNSYLDEDECVLELIVNQIVDQSIIDVNFRYNGVRLCFHFMENIRPTSSGQTFENFLFKRCQRECSRKVTPTTSANTFNHLRGLALFAADLFARSKAPSIAENLPNLLINILSTNSSTKLDDNVKCVYQVLKLCGQQLDTFYNEQGKDDVKTVFKKLGEATEKCDVPAYFSDMIKNLIKLAESGWNEQPKPSQAPLNIKNPYQNANNENLPNNSGYYESHYSSNYPPTIQEMYDFGGDECDEEVCQDFENFLRNLPPNNSWSIETLSLTWGIPVCAKSSWNQCTTDFTNTTFYLSKLIISAISDFYNQLFLFLKNIFPNWPTYPLIVDDNYLSTLRRANHPTFFFSLFWILNP